MVIDICLDYLAPLHQQNITEQCIHRISRRNHLWYYPLYTETRDFGWRSFSHKDTIPSCRWAIIIINWDYFESPFNIIKLRWLKESSTLQQDWPRTVFIRIYKIRVYTGSNIWGLFSLCVSIYQASLHWNVSILFCSLYSTGNNWSIKLTKP